MFLRKTGIVFRATIFLQNPALILRETRIISMRKMLVVMLFAVVWQQCMGQMLRRTLGFYVESAKKYSPLIKTKQIQSETVRQQLLRLRAAYMRSRVELTGECLFVPVVLVDGNRTSFKWNAQDGKDYYGYDLGESSGHTHVGISWTKPLLGRIAYDAAKKQAEANNAVLANDICVEEHELERLVAEQFLQCLLCKAQRDFADTTEMILKQQYSAVKRLADNFILKQSDVKLLEIQIKANDEQLLAAMQDYSSNLATLNMLCGIQDTATVELQAVELEQRPMLTHFSSGFAERYRLDSMNVAAELRAFATDYKPKLNLYADGGLQTGDYSRWFRHWGWSVGLSLSWTLYDGRQMRMKQKEAQLQQLAIRTNRNDAELKRKTRVAQCLGEIIGYRRRLQTMQAQIAEYDEVLDIYAKEMKAGQLSVLDYISVLRNKVETLKNKLLVQTNMQLATVAYNYWNW